MRTEDRKSAKDLNANPDNDVNRNKPLNETRQFPESREAHDESERRKHTGKKDDKNIELLADEVQGTVSSRDTGSSPEDIAGVSDLDQGMRRSRRRS